MCPRIHVCARPIRQVRVRLRIDRSVANTIAANAAMPIAMPIADPLFAPFGERAASIAYDAAAATTAAPVHAAHGRCVPSMSMSLARVVDAGCQRRGRPRGRRAGREEDERLDAMRGIVRARVDAA